MPPLYYVAIFTFSLAGAIFQSISGFGYAVVTMSLLPHVIPYSHAVALSALCSVTTSLFIVLNSWRSWRLINWKALIPCVITCLPAVALAVRLAAAVGDKTMMRALGVALIALGVYSIFFSAKIHFKATLLNGAIVGALAGILSGLFSTGGPPVAIYMLESASCSEEYRVTLSAYFVILTGSAVVARALNGVYSAPVLHAYGLLLVSLAIGTWLGSKIFRRLSPQKLRVVVYSCVILSGLTMLLK